jgi:hypothetical protein
VGLLETVKHLFRVPDVVVVIATDTINRRINRFAYLFIQRP